MCFGLDYFINRRALLDFLDPSSNVFYESPSDNYFYSFLNEETRILILGDLLKVEQPAKPSIHRAGRVP
jgi:hypothetical protein